MNNSPINSTINSTTVVELADASSLRMHFWSNFPIIYVYSITKFVKLGYKYIMKHEKSKCFVGSLN